MSRRRRGSSRPRQPSPPPEGAARPFLPPGFPSSLGEASWFAPALAAAYALVLAFAMSHHEMWRDELQHWMLVRDSAGPWELFRNAKYETIPKLWHLLLLPVTQLTQSPLGMQILHGALASAVVFVVARYAPFDPLQKLLFAFGYFPLFEYGVMSRNYALGLLFVVMACALWRSRHRRPLRLALVLALMSNTGAHACIVAIALLLALLLDGWLARRTLARDGTVDPRRLCCGLAIVAAGIALSVLQMIPPPDVTLSTPTATWEHSWYLEWNPAWLAICLKTIPFALFFPADPEFVPVVGLITGVHGAVYGVAVALALPAVVVAFCWRRPVALFLFLCLVAGFLTFFYAVHLGSFRHWGFLLISLLIVAWVSALDGSGPPGPAAGPGPESRRALHARRIGRLLLTGLLAMHAFGGIRAVAMEVERPFSQAAAAAAYIRANGLESLPIIGFPDWPAIAVLGHLSPEKRIHYVQGNREGSFVRWDGARIGTGPQGGIEDRTLFSQTQALAARNHGRVLMLLAVPLEIPPEERRLEPLASFTGAIATDEDFYLYLYRPPPGDARSGSHVE